MFGRSKDENTTSQSSSLSRPAAQPSSRKDSPMTTSTSSIPTPAPSNNLRSSTSPSLRRPSMPGSNSFSPSSSTQDSRRLIVGPEIVLKGEIGACDQLLVQGTVEATIKGAENLNISQSGLYKGTVEIQDAEIAGRFEGNLTVSGRLTVRSTGQISGTISYGEMQIEAGAILDGSISPMNNKAKSSTTPSSSATATSAKSAMSKASKPANEGGSLLDGATNRKSA